MSLAVTPKNLLQAMWYQFGLAVSGHKQYRRCSVCQDWFEVSPSVARTNRLFCSAACKNKSYRARQQKARDMHEDGSNLKEIARELGTSVATVKGWLDAGRKGE